MKTYIKASTIDALRDEVDELYELAYDSCNPDIVEGILIDCGASEDDNGPYGFLTGVNEAQLKRMISELKSLLYSVKGEEVYSIQLSETELELVYKAISSFTPPDAKTRAQLRVIRHKLTRY